MSMNREQILFEIEHLARSQGFYGRLLKQINNLSPDLREDVLSELENQQFEDVLDMIFFFEC